MATATADDDEVQEKPKGSSLTKILLIVLIPLIVAGGTVGGLYFAGVFGGDPEQDASADEEDMEEDVPAGPAIYIPMDPAFVVNFPEGSKARFLQITMEIMTRKPEVQAQVEMHSPAIRNNLVLLFSSQTYERVSTLEGKEALREEALGVVQEILEQETGDPGIEAVYFTSLVMQ
jgi:flagellar FliL protein